MPSRLSIPLVRPLILPACHSHDRPTYAIRDFNPTLQPLLIAAVSTGEVGYDSASVFIREHATTEDLSCPGRKSPIRGNAHRALVERPRVG